MITSQKKINVNFLVFVLLFMLPVTCHGDLIADEIAVVANRNVPESRFLAEYYMNKRQVPDYNLLMINVSPEEHISRSEYENEIVAPIKSFLSKQRKEIRCLVIMYGVPLKVLSPPVLLNQKKEMSRLKEQKSILENRIKFEPGKGGNTSDQEAVKKIKGKIASLFNVLDKEASVDSELSLVKKEDYSLSMWQPNPFFAGFTGKPLSIRKNEVMMVSRLDASTPEIVRRVIDDGLYAEKNGAGGYAYFDARWADPGGRQVSGYEYYDRSLHRAALRTKEARDISVIINRKEELFGLNECPDAFLYCGWYSLASYVDSFFWKRGAIGYHMASSECETLKKKESRVWCKVMLDKGVAATIGPVGEPYIQAFPVPEIFFSGLVEKRMNLIESYFLSVPFLSWKMVLIGDPLYKPFKKGK